MVKNKGPGTRLSELKSPRIHPEKLVICIKYIKPYTFLMMLFAEVLNCSCFFCVPLPGYELTEEQVPRQSLLTPHGAWSCALMIHINKYLRNNEIITVLCHFLFISHLLSEEPETTCKGKKMQNMIFKCFGAIQVSRLQHLGNDFD